MYTEQLKLQAKILAKHPKLREGGILFFRVGEKYVCIGEFAPRAAQLVGRAEFSPNDIDAALHALYTKGLILAISE
jgi:hypothetical protein